MKLVEALVALFGFFYLLVLLVKFAWMGAKHAWKSRRLARERYNYWIGQFTEAHGEGTWAVVTGGSDEFGYALCCELAETYKFNICIVAKDEDVIADRLHEIHKKYKVKVRSIQVDFQEFTTLQTYEKVVKQALSELHIGILVLNASSQIRRQFRDTDYQTVQELTAVNSL